MQLLALVSALAAIGSGCWVSTRLLALARRTGEIPERWVGAGLFAFAALAYPLLLLASAGVEGLPAPVLRGTTVAACLAYVASLGCLAWFTRCVFRPGRRWAAGWVALLCAVAAAGAVLIIGATVRGAALAPGGSPFGASPLGSGLVAAAFSVLFGWASFEALLWHARMRRRRRLGLADPTVENRFLVWGVGTGLASLVVFGIVLCTAAGLDVGRDLVPGLLQSGSGLFNAATWALTFAPPRRYREWVVQRAGAAREAAHRRRS